MGAEVGRPGDLGSQRKERAGWRFVLSGGIPEHRSEGVSSWIAVLLGAVVSPAGAEIRCALQVDGFVPDRYWVRAADPVRVRADEGALLIDGPTAHSGFIMAEYTVDGVSVGILPHRIAWDADGCTPLHFSTFFVSGILVAAPSGSGPVMIEGCGSAVPVIEGEFSGVFFAGSSCQLSAEKVRIGRGSASALQPQPGERVSLQLVVPEVSGTVDAVLTEQPDRSVVIASSSHPDLPAGAVVETINEHPASRFGPIALHGLQRGPLGETLVIGLAEREVRLIYQ